MKNYFKIAAYFVFVAWVMGISVNTTFALSSGPPDGRTGSPADNFKTCKDTGCHNSYPLNSGSATFSITAPVSYTLGETLNVSISFGNSPSSKPKHGFELSALDANNNHAGTFNKVDSKTQTTNGTYIKHTSTGSSQSGNASWNVQWTAPASAVQDPVTFYAAGNEANGDFTPNGDYIYTTSTELSNVVPPPPVETIVLSPVSATNFTGTQHIVTATVEDESAGPIEGIEVSFEITSGPHTGQNGTDTTDSNGQATFAYTGTLEGTDTIVASFVDSQGSTITSNEVTKTWIIPISLCEPEKITLNTKRLKLKFGESKTVIVTVSGSNECIPEEATVNAAIKTGKKRITLNPANAPIDANGQATFTITAGQKIGNAKVEFTVEDSNGGIYKAFVIVKIRKK